MATQAELLAQDKIYQTQQSVSSTNIHVGTAASGVTAVERGNDVFHQVTLSVNTTLGAIAGGAALGLGKKIYDLPAGAVVTGLAYMSVAITQTQGHINADVPKVGLGTVIASGAVSVLSGTATFQDILAGVSATNCTGTPTLGLTNTPVLKAAAAARSVYLNVAATWAASGDAAALLTGTVVLDYVFMK